LLSQRAIEKHVEEALGSDERWRVIVRGNSWLCPFCLSLGARDLRMDEAIESKIAVHFIRACPAWEYFEVEPNPIDRLRQAARLQVFRGRVARWIGEEPRFRVGDAEKRWICPYCLEVTDGQVPSAPLETLQDSSTGVTQHIEDSDFVADVTTHLLQCGGFSDGEDKLRTLRELEEVRAKSGRRVRVSRVRRRFERQPEYRLMDQERRWLCPFCAVAQDVRVVDKPQDDFFEGLADHLETCKAHAVLDGQPRPVEELKARVAAGARSRQLEKIQNKMQRHAVWRVRDLEGNWHCPYCATNTQVPYPQRDAEGQKDPGEEDLFHAAVLEHLGTCEDYRRPKARVRSRQDMAQAVARANVHIDRHRRLRKALSNNPLFTVTDAYSNWVCPYCVKIQKHVVIPSGDELDGVFSKTVDQVVHHLFEGGCDGFVEGRGTASTRAQLEAVVREATDDVRSSRAGEGSGSGLRLVDSLDERAWTKIKADLQAVRHRVERATEVQSSLREARSKQLRLLPEVPQLQGFEFARVYKPCDAVGGDFYAFFQASEHALGMAIGDISGHGIEAALLMGLAKKLLEVHGRERDSAAQTLVLANRDIFSDLDDRTFVTVFYGLLDTRTRLFKFSRAGHDPLVLYNPQRDPPLQVIDSKGMALGMDEGPMFERTLEELEIALRPGDLVVQYTDGVTETMNHTNQQFGHERLYAVIEENGRHEAEYVLWRIEKALEAFRGARPAGEDMTLVAFKVME
jgi:serine phosphatase RsbU (regulator of sigma subunit)